MSVKIKFDKRKLKQAVEQQATSTLNNRKYDVTCPHCKHKVKVPAGKSLCPHCHQEVDLKLNINL